MPVTARSVAHHVARVAHRLARLVAHDQVDVALADPRSSLIGLCATGSGRSALAAMAQGSANTDSSPRLLVIPPRP